LKAKNKPYKTITQNKSTIMKKYIFIAAVALMPMLAKAQVYKTAAGKISFVSKTSIEEFSANNSQVEAAIAPANNQLQFRVPVNGFVFKSALMQKHFQENYMETSRFQYSNFKGKIKNMAAVNFAQNGEYPVEAVGQMTMHGVTKDITVPGKVVVKDGAVTLKANFKIKCSDYQIKIPAASAASVSDDIAIAVDCALAK
jgi:polyisoprenoid-binding protein YceI